MNKLKNVYILSKVKYIFSTSNRNGRPLTSSPGSYITLIRSSLTILISLTICVPWRPQRPHNIETVPVLNASKIFNLIYGQYRGMQQRHLIIRRTLTPPLPFHPIIPNLPLKLPKSAGLVQRR